VIKIQLLGLEHVQCKFELATPTGKILNLDQGSAEKGFGLVESKLLLYTLLVEPYDPAVADLDHRHPRLAGLANPFR
jgi:hypothetical protein